MEKSNGGIKGVTHPIVADTNKTISKNFDVLKGDYFVNENDELGTDNEMIAYRGLFLIDKEGVVQHQLVNNLPLGRSVDEALRMVTLSFRRKRSSLPGNWEKGKDAMNESHEGVADFLSKH